VHPHHGRTSSFELLELRPGPGLAAAGEWRYYQNGARSDITSAFWSAGVN